ncbi:MAG: methyltransferase family protein, partial [Eubacteriales bacterium]
MPNSEYSEQNKQDYWRITAIGLFTRLLMTAVIFISAGRITYWQGWVFSGISVLRVLISSLVFVNKTDLIEERAKPGPGTKWWDKILYSLYVPLLIAMIIVGSLDAGRFGWTPQIPISIYLVILLVNNLAYGLNLWAMWTNRFFSSTVRIQTDREHEVIQDGPYRFIRHPGNLGVILLETSGSLVLGSLWALIPAVVIVVLVIIRTYLED